MAPRISHQPLNRLLQVAYQRILNLSYPDELLNAMKTLFLKLFQPFLTTFVASLHITNPSTVAIVNSTILDFRKAFEGWDKFFDKLLAGFEERAGKVYVNVVVEQISLITIYFFAGS